VSVKVQAEATEEDKVAAANAAANATETAPAEVAAEPVAEEATAE
jgi:hypothetical protein